MTVDRPAPLEGERPGERPGDGGGPADVTGRFAAIRREFELPRGVAYL